jgi:UPF0271 protein
LSHGVQIGAHPAYQDLVGFGRRSMAYSAQELQDILHYQIGALDGICKAQGGGVSYVKPHGAMYNDMMANPAQLRAVIQAVAAYDRSLPLMLMATRDNSAAQQIGDEYGVTLWFEAFAARGDNLTASDGSALRLHANTLCVHGDNASSVAAVQRIREALNQQSAS